MNLGYNKQYEREFRDMMNKSGNHCERVAGSGSGKSAVCDCVLFTSRGVFLVEIKATKKEVYKVDSNTKQQLEKMKKVADKYRLNVMLAIRYKRRKTWELRRYVTH